VLKAKSINEVVSVHTEFYEELLSLVYSLTSRQISTRMWQILPHLYRLFYDDNMDLFVGELFGTASLLCFVVHSYCYYEG